MWNGGEMSELESHPLIAGTYKGRDYAGWAMKNYGSLLNSPPYEANIGPVLILEALVRNRAFFRWSDYTDFQKQIAETRPEYLELLDLELFRAYVKRENVVTGHETRYSGGEWKTSSITTKLVTGASIESANGLDIHPLVCDGAVVITHSSISEFVRANTKEITKGLLRRKPDPEGQRAHDDLVRRCADVLMGYHDKAVEARYGRKLEELQRLTPGWIREA